MAADAQTVKALRDRTGAGVMDCKVALQASQGDLDGAVEYLRKKGLADAQKRQHRETKEGVVASYIHPGAKLGVLVEVGRGGMSAEDATALLTHSSGLVARLTAPASGLFLARVYYEGDRRDAPLEPLLSLRRAND